MSNDDLRAEDFPCWLALSDAWMILNETAQEHRAGTPERIVLEAAAAYLQDCRGVYACEVLTRFGYDVDALLREPAPRGGPRG